MKTQKLIHYLIFIGVILASCKGKDGEVGPAGPPGEINILTYYTYKEGTVACEATGTTLDGTPYSYDFDFQGVYDATDNTYKVISGTETEISIWKTYAGDGETLVWGDIGLTFSVTSLSDLSSPTVEDFNLNFNKDLGSNVFHQAYYYWNSGYSSGTFTVSNLAYNSSTGILSGNYSVSIPANSSTGNLSISGGTFSTKLSKVIAKMSAN